MSNDSKIPTFSQGRRARTRVCLRMCFKNSQNTEAKQTVTPLSSSRAVNVILWPAKACKGHEALLQWRAEYKLLNSQRLSHKTSFHTKQLQIQTHTCIFLLHPQHSKISARKGGRLKEHAWGHPFSAALGMGSSRSSFIDECATRESTHLAGRED